MLTSENVKSALLQEEDKQQYEAISVALSTQANMTSNQRGGGNFRGRGRGRGRGSNNNQRSNYQK